MGLNLDEENIGLLLHESPPNPKKGGHRTIPFIIVNEAFERLASTGLVPNMVIYLMDGYHLKLATASIMLSISSALSNGLTIFGAFIADSYLGRFRTIAFGSIFSTLGMTIIWSTTMIPQLKPPPCDDKFNYSICNNSPTAPQLLVLIGAFGINSIGAACIRPCSIAFGADQLVNKLDNIPNYNQSRPLETFINWYCASIALSAVIALTVVVYIQDNLGWQVGFGVPALFMAFSALIFFLGSSLYIKIKPTESFLTGLVQVLVVAFKKRKISLPPTTPSQCDDCINNICYHNCHESKLLVPTDNLRCLNKACIITNPEIDLKPDGSASDSWNLCTVEQIESLKAFLRVIPMWSAGIAIQVAVTQNSFTTPQAKTMDRHLTKGFEIPAGSFIMFMVISQMLWVGFYEAVVVPILARYAGKPRGLSPKTRIGLGIIISCLAMAMSAVVESTRRRVAIEQGLEDEPNAVVDMSAMWLVPQFVLLGIADTLISTGQTEFFYTQLPKQMSSISIAILTLQMSAASLVASVMMSVVESVTSKGGKISWLSSNLNKGHVDYYYWLIAFLSLLNFVYFLICCRGYGPSEEQMTGLSDEVNNIEGGNLNI